MLQIATFTLPDEQDQANEFLKTHKPIGNIEFSKDLLFMGFEDGEYPVAYQISDLQEMIRSNRAARLQQEIAMQVLEYERADLNPKHNKNRYDELTSALINMKRGMDIQDMKAAWAEKRITELQAK